MGVIYFFDAVAVGLPFRTHLPRWVLSGGPARAYRGQVLGVWWSPTH